MHKHFILISSLISVVILAFLLNFTNPSGVGPFGILVFFILFYVVMFGLATGVVTMYEKMVRTNKKSKIEKYLYAAVIGFAPSLVLLMRTFGMLDILSICLAILFVFLGCFLIKNRFGVVK